MADLKITLTLELERILQDLEEAGIEALSVDTVLVPGGQRPDFVEGLAKNIIYHRHRITLTRSLYVKVLEDLQSQEFTFSVCQGETVQEKVHYNWQWLNWPIDWPDGDLSLELCNSNFDTEVRLQDWSKMLNCLKRICS